MVWYVKRPVYLCLRGLSGQRRAASFLSAGQTEFDYVGVGKLQSSYCRDCSWSDPFGAE